MHLEQTLDSRRTQPKIGFQRPRLYTIPEAARELDVSYKTLRGLISRFQIRPPIGGAAKKYYRLSDFQEALNKAKDMNFVIEKGIPLPPKYGAKSSKYMNLEKTLGVGDSVLLTLEDAAGFLSYTHRASTHKYASRKEGGDHRRVWRLE